MVAARVKFRCVHCDRLLSAPVSRIGRTIACPKCVQAVTIPDLGAGSELDAGRSAPLQQAQPAPASVGPERPDSTSTGSASPSGEVRTSEDALPKFMVEIAAAIPDEVLSLQPEDIRAEIPLLDLDAGPGGREELPLEAAPMEQSALAAFATAPTSPFAADPDASGEVQVDSWLNPVESGSDQRRNPEIIAPPIEIEPILPPPIPSNSSARRADDVVMPASVVLAWSLFVLAALALAFLAGLMIGHYYWKTPPTS